VAYLQANAEEIQLEVGSTAKRLDLEDRATRGSSGESDLEIQLRVRAIIGNMLALDDVALRRDNEAQREL
jgi:hypothetical protein